MALAAPIVFQCGACYRVVSDSNQLVAAVADLGVLVLDAVVGVRIGTADAAAHTSPLHCSVCGHTLGRIYQQPPQQAFIDLVHTDSEPRYALIQNALASYVLGSAAAHGADEGGGGGQGGGGRAAAATAAATAHAEEGTTGTARAATLSTASRLEALESGEASAQQQLTQLMRVVLALDQRLHAVEEAGVVRGSAAVDEIAVPARKTLRRSPT